MSLLRSDNSITVGAALSAVNQHDFWLRYFALGGTRSADDLRAYLYGAVAWPGVERAIVDQALHEHHTGLEPIKAASAPAPASPPEIPNRTPMIMTRAFPTQQGPSAGAAPALRREALTAQSTKVDTVSGATYTS
jgi:hypothetical protein